MRLVHNRRISGVIGAAALVAAGCGGQSGTAVDVAEPVPDDDVAASPESVATDNGASAPAAAAGLADESYDEAYLAAGPGQGFPSLDDPLLIAGADATWIDADDVVMGIVADNGEAQAYPVNQMAYHHVANTSLAGEPFLVTY